MIKSSRKSSKFPTKNKRSNLSGDFPKIYLGVITGILITAFVVLYLMITAPAPMKNGNANINSKLTSRQLAEKQARIDDINKILTSSSTILVNANNPIEKTFKPSLTKKINGVDVEERAASSYEEMVRAAKNDNITDIRLYSGYRTYDYQKTLYDKEVTNLMKNDKSLAKAEAEAQAKKSVAVPGTSEHQTGLAFDISNAKGLTEAFFSSKTYQWLVENAPKYGFIQRFPEDKESITGIEFEAWHFRYVTTPVAKEISASGFSLEEYIQELTTELEKLRLEVNAN